MKTFLSSLIFVLFVLFVPTITRAGYYTLPIDDLGDADINECAWFDHYAAPIDKIMYNGSTSFSYDNHRGTDYCTTDEGKDVLAAASGVVRKADWENPDNPAQGYGLYVRVYHEYSDESTVYGHLSATSTNLNDNVVRYQPVGLSGDTGLSSEPHLHFGVYDGDSVTASEQMDPYGWRAGSPNAWEGDPWSKDKGYLWTTDTPSFATSTEVSTNIMATTTWRGNILVNGSLYISSGVTLTVEPNTVVKFKTTSSKLTVNGTLNAQGTEVSPVYFTSYKDDTVGGDTNGDATSTTPSAADWKSIYVSSTGSTTLSHAVVRYGGYVDLADVYNNGGIVNIFNSVIAYTPTTSAAGVGVYAVSGTTTITSTEIHHNRYGVLGTSVVNILSGCNIHDNAYYGLSVTSGQLSVSDTDFSNSGMASGLIDGSVASFNHSDNEDTGGVGGFFIRNHINSDRTWTADGVPYIIYGTVYVDSGKTLTIEHGAVVKVYYNGSSLIVNGILNAQGESGDEVIFTSYEDDDAIGDTNGDATTTSGSAGDWREIEIGSTGSTTLSHTIVRYGGGGTGSGIRYANVYNNGGVVNIFNSEIAHTPTTAGAGVRAISGTTTIASTEIHDDRYGIVGTSIANVSTCSVYNNTYYGIYVTSGQLSISDTEFSNSGISSVKVDASVSFVHSGNTDLDGPGGLFVTGTVNSNQTWTNDNIPYVVEGTVYIASSKTLTIDPETVIKFYNSGSRIVVNGGGTLDVQGSTSSPVYFTSYKDDVGGDTNGDATSTSPATGDWRGIEMASVSNATISGAMIFYGGANSGTSPPRANVYNNGGTLTVSDSQIASSSVYGISNNAGTAYATTTKIYNNSHTGIMEYGGTLNVSACEIYDNTYYGIRTNGGAVYVTGSSIHGNPTYGMYKLYSPDGGAENNYWGDASGPYHATKNSDGTGDNVSDNVDFEPFLDSDPFSES